jgi:hypothetical protein
MQLNDFLGLGKILPIDKLIEVVSNSVGRLSKSYFDKKDAQSKAYEIKKIAEARAEEMRIMSLAVKENFKLTGGIEYKEEKLIISSPKQEIAPENMSFESELETRVKNRIDFKETKKQLNIENITAVAADTLKEEQEIPNNPIDEDWTTRFFNIAEDISSEEMQFLWGKILAGEIKSPKSYSLRTLEVLKNLTKDEANIFSKFGQARLFSGNNTFIYNPDNGKLLQDLFGITFADRLLLTELGLIASENNLEFSYIPTEQKKMVSLIEYGNKAIVLNRNENTPKQPIEVLLFTKVGIELSRLIVQIPKDEYIQNVCDAFSHQNVTIEYGDLAKFPNGQILLINKKQYVKQ